MNDSEPPPLRGGYFFMVVLAIFRYKKRNIPFALLSMPLFHIILYLKRNIGFYKLMGSGKNGTFDKTPDWQQWAIMFTAGSNTTLAPLGHIINTWLNWFAHERIVYTLTPIEGHGYWDKKQPFGTLPPKSEYEGPIAILTRATIRLSKLSAFWKNVDAVALQMVGAKGYITSYGIGEIPWIKQATISFWHSKEDMKNFAYRMHQHADVIKKTRTEKWYSEDMFVRFKIESATGQLLGTNKVSQELGLV